ncbi:AEC family transporter [Mangrovicella endophytica]|uniref:AEC family transporter n=1 Tax=Mangrovicella endophytica TaxID=2066697 RepID=UPI000C9E9C27|nr:AEC family transporter [Mangrovicella endophytica]
MIAIVGLISPFFALIALGFLAGRVAKLPIDGLAWMNLFIVYVSLPALFFQLLSKTPVEELASGSFVIGTTAATFAVFAAGLAIALLRRAGLPAATIQGLAGAYGNIGYMGPGLALVALGPKAAVPVALVFCFDNTLHFVMAPLMMALAGGRSDGLGALAKGVAVKVFTHPFILATIVGIGAAIVGLRLPEPADRLLALLAAAAAPCALFAMGVTLALRPLRRVPIELSTIVPLKLVLHPLAVWLALGLIGGVDPLWIKAAVLLASLPTATNVFVIAQQYQVWVERASAAVLVTTVVSVATVTTILYLLSSGMLPADPFAH